MDRWRGAGRGGERTAATDEALAIRWQEAHRAESFLPHAADRIRDPMTRLLLPVLLFACLPLWSEEPVLTIHPDRVVRRDADRWLGINLNYIRDLDANRSPGARPLRTALDDLGVRRLRYPGGEKSDHHRFAEPPYVRAAPRSLGWYAECAGQRMDFDAYVGICRARGAEPWVVVACESEKNCGATWDEQLAHAVSWVRYANIEKGYGIRLWEIGNENWHNGTATPRLMAAIVSRFAQAMRAVDPTIRLGASGNDDAWWKEFLPGAARDLDYLSVSVYSTWGWRSYDRILQAPEPDLLGAAGSALKAIAELPEAGDRERLTVMVAETNSVDYSEGGWPRTNTLGHAIITFEGFARMLGEPRIAGALLWNTRWMDDDEAPTDQFYALDARNRLLPAGLAVALWGRHLHANLLTVDGSQGDLRAYASATADSGAWSVWLVNRGREPIGNLRVRLGTLPAGAVEISCLHGSGPDDPLPTLDAPVALPSRDGETGHFTCPPVSITVITGGR